MGLIRVKSIKLLLFGLFLTLLCCGEARADFNNINNNAFIDWTTRPQTTSAGNTSSTSGTTSPTSTSGDSSAILKTICNNIFRFQKDNVLQGSFCALINIASVSTASFATDVTCTIQSVGMSNYDDNIKFTSPLSSGTNSSGSSLCLPTTTSNSQALKVSSGPDVFGRGRLMDSGAQTGIYANANQTQLSYNLSPGTKSWIYDSYRIIRSIAMLLGLVLLFIIAFANILHIDVNTYTIKRMIPNLVIAIIGGYLSIYVIYIISRGIDFIYQFQAFSPYNAIHPFYNIIGGGGNLNLGAITNTDAGLKAVEAIFNIGGSILGTAVGSDNRYSLISAILGTVFLMVPAIIVFGFEYMLALRPIAVGILTIVSPIAFACYVMPQTQNIFKKWWTLLLIALFYTPMVNFVFYILNSITIPNSNDGLMLVIGVLVKSAVVVVLIRMPFTIEADIKKITLALQKSSLAANLGLGKSANAELKAKEQNKVGGVTDKALQSKAAQSLIAPVNRNFNRNMAGTINREDSKSTIRSFAQIINRNNPAADTREIESISDKAHKTNLMRPSNILVNSTSDIKPQTFRKILNSSNQSLFREVGVVSELKNKNGQVLDNEGAALRADAVRKVTSLAKVVDGEHIAHPDAVKSLSQKGLLDVLPIEILQLSLQQGVIGANDLKTNFKNPEAAYNKIVNFKRGLSFGQNPLDRSSLLSEMEQDHRDSASGFTDLKSAIRSSVELPQPSQNSRQGTYKIIEDLRSQNQTQFDNNAPYYISRLKMTNDNSRENIARTLQVAGTPGKTAIALSQNPNLSFDQIKKYLPQTASPEIVSTIRQSVDSRDISQGAINQITKAFKEDKSVLGRTVADKVSESFKSGSSRNFDDVKTQLTQAVKTLSSNPTPQDAKKAMSQVGNFAPGTAISSAAVPTAEEIEKTKEKGEQVIGTIDGMKMAGIKEETVANNPAQAAEQFDTHISEQIGGILAGQTKEGKTVEGQIADLSAKNPTNDQQELSNSDQSNGEDESMKTIADIASEPDANAASLSSKTRDGESFDQQIGEISAKGNSKI